MPGLAFWPEHLGRCVDCDSAMLLESQGRELNIQVLPKPPSQCFEQFLSNDANDEDFSNCRRP